jgi:hypothetical protein
VGEVYAAWRKYHPHADERPTDERRKLIQRAVKEAGKDGAILVIDYIHRPGSWWAEKKRTSLETIMCWSTSRRSATFTSLLDEARDWKPDGPRTAPDRINGVTPEAAWSMVLDKAEKARWRVPKDGWHPNPDVHDAIVKGIRSVGGLATIGQSTPQTEREIRASFLSTFREAYHG